MNCKRSLCLLLFFYVINVFAYLFQAQHWCWVSPHKRPGQWVCWKCPRRRLEELLMSRVPLLQSHSPIKFQVCLFEESNHLWWFLKTNSGPCYSIVTLLPVWNWLWQDQPILLLSFKISLLQKHNVLKGKGPSIRVSVYFSSHDITLWHIKIECVLTGAAFSLSPCLGRVWDTVRRSGELLGQLWAWGVDRTPHFSLSDFCREAALLWSG